MTTVYVLGAGASAELKLPVGETLAEDIRELVNFKQNSNTKFRQAIYTYVQHTDRGNYSEQVYLDKIKHACDQIYQGLPFTRSIDNFVDMHRENEFIALCAKLAIAYCILRAENKSLLNFTNESLPFLTLTKKDTYLDSWHLSLFKQLNEGCTFEEFKNRLSTVSFIVFNYDRCLEQYLIHAIVTAYNRPLEEAVEIVKNVSIFHPYGQVGSVWQEEGLVYNKYGSEPSHDDLIRIAFNIKTFTEGAESSEAEGIQKTIESAEKLVFLGFAFHPLNMELIQLDQITKDRQKPEIFGTAMGFSSSDTLAIQSKLLRYYSLYSRKLNPLEDSTCGEFFKNNVHTISFS